MLDLDYRFNLSKNVNDKGHLKALVLDYHFEEGDKAFIEIYESEKNIAQGKVFTIESYGFENAPQGGFVFFLIPDTIPRGKYQFDVTVATDGCTVSIFERRDLIVNA